MNIVRLPVDIMFGTWSINAPTKDQLEQLPEFDQQRVRSVNAGTSLKYLIASLASGVYCNEESEFVIRVGVSDVMRALGETGNNYAGCRAGLVASANLLFRPANDIKDDEITLERIVTRTTTDPRKTGKKSSIEIKLDRKFGEIFKHPKQYVSVNLHELGQLRESGNIFTYLSFLRYAGLDMQFDQNKLAKLLTRPHETPLERINSYFKNGRSRGWSLIRRDLTTKISNIEKNTSLRVRLEKPKDGMVKVKIRSTNKKATSDKIRSYANRLERLFGISARSAISKLNNYETVPDFEERFEFVVCKITPLEQKGDSKNIGSIEGRNVGPGLIMNFLSGDDVFVEYRSTDIRVNLADTGSSAGNQQSNNISKEWCQAENEYETLISERVELWLSDNESGLTEHKIRSDWKREGSSLTFEKYQRNVLLRLSRAQTKVNQELGVLRKEDAIKKIIKKQSRNVNG